MSLECLIPSESKEIIIKDTKAMTKDFSHSFRDLGLEKSTGEGCEQPKWNNSCINKNKNGNKF